LDATVSKGKREPASKPEVLTFTEANERLDDALSVFQGSYDTVALLPGDHEFKGDLVKAVRKLVKGDFDLIAVEGDLVVDGRIQLYEATPGLYVGGSTKANTLEGGDCEIYLQHGTFACFVYGYYNDGTLETGGVDTPWVINSNHDLRVAAGKTTKWIDNYGDDDDYDFGSENIGTSFVEQVLGKSGNEIDIEAFYKRLVAGKSVLVEGAKTTTEATLAKVKGAKAEKKTELVITRKLKKFPADALKMTWLKRLAMDGSELGTLPAGIKKLRGLEELSLTNCKLEKLPAEIGELGELRILRIAGNKAHDWSGDEPVCVPIELPKTIGNLAKLEELDVSELSGQVLGQDDRVLPDIEPFELPASAAKLKKLRVLRANRTNLVLPKAMWGLESLEEIEMSGSSWCYLKEFPEWITSFPNLKKLDLSSNFFSSIPSLAKLTRLEELDLGNSLGFVKKLPDLSKLSRLRVLKISGNTDHTSVREPAHDVLRPLFAMKLPAIEELSIDRWGKGDGGRKELAPQTIAGIGKLKTLKKLDLAFDGLAKLPADLYELTALEELNLDYNRLGKQELVRIAKAFPKAKIEIGIQD
jgi:Leucine-rich repeat (LRR) protein